MINLQEIELIYNSIPTPCVILQPDAPVYTIAAANKAFTTATGTKSESLIGQPFFAVFPSNVDDDGSRTKDIKDSFEHVLKNKTPQLVPRHRYRVPASSNVEQHPRYWNVETYPILDENKCVKFIVQSSTDITALMEAEKQLERNNERLKQQLKDREIMEVELQKSNERYKYVNLASNEVIYDWNITQNNIEWNHAFHLYGYKPEEQFSIESWKKLLHPEDRPKLVHSLYAALDDRNLHIWTGGYRLMRLDGQYSDIEGNGYILRDEHGNAVRMMVCCVMCLPEKWRKQNWNR